MIEPTTGSVLLGWKVLSGLYAKYQVWDLRKKTSKRAVEQKARAAVLMEQINRGILSGGSSNQSPLIELVSEFEELVKSDPNLDDYKSTKWMISRSNSGAYQLSGGRSPVPAKKAAATAKKAAPARKMAAKRAAPAKKAASAKKTTAKRA